MAASLTDVDPRAAERLQDLADAIDSEAGRLRWADVDLRRAFNTDHLAHAYAVRREGGFAPASIDIADKVRNVLVFLPIFLTWFALYEASRAYGSYIEQHPDEVRQPFLLLWQQGFGEGAGILSPSFSTVAIVDALVIASIIGLTFYVHGRRERREDAINDTAQAFQRDIDNVLAEATVALAPDRAGRPAMLARSVERLAERFEANSQELLTRLQVEHDRLDAISNRREKEFADFGVFASGMRAGAEETHKLLLDLRQVSTGLSQALEDLTSEVGVSGDQQRSLFTAVTSLERLVATGIQSDHSVTRQLTDAAQTLADAADKSLAGAEAAAQAGRIASEAVRGIAEISSALASSQTRVESALANETEVNSRLADALRGGMNGVNASAKTLSDVQGALTQLRTEFSRIGDISQEHSHTLSRLMTEQNAISTNLAQVARDFGTLGSAQSNRQREIHEEFSSLLHRLDNIASMMARMTGSPDYEPAGQTSGGTIRSMLPNAPDLLADPPEPPAPGARGGRGLWPRREP
jgi:archaellum component FlaC